MKKILIAPNAFKGSLEADAAARAIEEGLITSNLNCTCRKLPIADGGDGSLKVIANYLEAAVLKKEVFGPLRNRVQARYGYNVSRNAAIVELAEASGIRLLKKDELNPWETTTYGTGQLIREAIEQGANTIYLTIGGSATVDGAVGILDALRVVFYAESRQIVIPGAKDLERITRIDISEIPEIIRNADLTILCDVTNPLLGEEGAARVFAPQKGASEEDVLQLEKGFENVVEVIKRDFGVDVGKMKRGGAAGGVSAILHGVLGAKLVPGGEQILNWADFDTHLAWADLVITGEGRIDEQTRYGKGPGLVAQRARNAGKPVIGLSGFVEAEEVSFPDFDMVFSICHKPGTLEEAMQLTGTNLKRMAYQVGNLMAVE